MGEGAAIIGPPKLSARAHPREDRGGDAVLGCAHAYLRRDHARVASSTRTPLTRRVPAGERAAIVDQRFLPRIVEGEVRVYMIRDRPVSVLHKKPAEGQLSATLFSGAK